MKLRHNRIMTDALREIRHTRSRFLSLLVLSALSVCFLAGLRATAPDMKNSADLYFDQQKLMDLRITSTLGLTEEDAAALERQEGVLAVERAYTVDAMVHLTDDDYIVKVLSFTESPGLNAPKLVEGRLPQTAGECLVEPLLLEETGLSLGDAIALDTGSGSYEDALALEKFTIVGTANSPLYIGVDRGTSSLGTGQVSAFVLLPLEAFTLETYTDFYLQVEGAQDLNSYSDAYTRWIDDFSDSLEPFADQRARMRGDEVIGEANEALADAEAELSDAQAEAEAELSDAWAQLEEGRADLDEGWAEYRDGVRELNDQVAQAEQEIADGQGELDEALSELNDGEQELTDARADLDEGWTEYYDGLRDYEDGLAEFEDGRRQYEEGLAEYYDGLDQYQEGLDDYEDGERQVEDGWDEYYAGLEQYNDGAEELEQGRETLREQEAAFQEGLTQFRENLGSLGLSQYAAMSNSQLLSAMTDSAQAAVIDGALNSTRTSLSQGIELLNSIDALRTQLGGNADTDLSLLQSQRDGLIASISDLQGDIAELQEALAALSPDSPTYEADRQQLQSAIDALSGQLSTAQGNLEQMEELIAARTTLAQLEEQRDAAGLTHATAASLQAQLDALSGVSTSVFLSGQRQIDQGWQEIYDGQAELEDAWQQLVDARRELLDAEAELEDAWAQLEDARLELEDGWAELEDARLEMEDGWAELEEARRQLEDALQELQDGERELADGQADLDEGWAEYNDGLAELEDARQTLAEETADAQLELSDALAQLQDGEAEYRDGLQEYREGEAEAQEQIADAQKELEQARRDIAEIEACQWYLLDRNTNAGYVSYSMDADRMGNLASVFPLIFFLVAALVCLTTMTRMVEEQRVTIGGLKALGYSKGAIAVKYVGYGFLASALGSLIGLAVGLTLLPWIICNAWNIIYTLGEVQYGLEPVTSSLACLAAVGTVTLSALGACFSTLTAVPAQLMRPKAPPAGKRVLLERLPFLWRRLSFNYKITIRNLFRYQRRFWMTVVGIGGCAALIVTAFGLRGSIFDIMDKQFDEIYGYTAQVGLVDQVTPGELREVTQALEESELVEDFLACSSQSVTAETDAYTVDATLQVFSSQEALEPFIHLRHRTDSQPVVLPDDGVVLTEKLAKLLGIQAGDTITLDGDARVEVQVADVTEHYIQHYVYMTDACYQAVFGTEPAQNLILADYPIDAPETEALERELVSLDGVTALTRMEDTRDTYGSSLESVDYAVVLIIVCAAALAFVVLYNLTNINITERMRELATLKVLGFYDRELSAYIYRENVVLTVFGVAMGMVMGKLLHQWLILTVEIDLLMFGRELSLGSYAYAVVLTVIFSLLVNLAAHRSLKKLDMVESLKTVE